MNHIRSRQQAEYLRALDQHFAELSIDEPPAGSFEGWFLGPKAENEELLKSLIFDAIKNHCDYRRAYHPEDPAHITDAIKQLPLYTESVENLRRHSSDLFERLQRSAPIASMRSHGHMLWDQVLPAMVGYFAGMLYNQNNVAAEVSPLTTQLEIKVGNDLCRMLGFRTARKGVPSAGITAWGHITCGGTIANIEGLWAARNLKFFPLALKAAILSVPEMARAVMLEVSLLNGRRKRLIDLDAWTLLNLKLDDVVSLLGSMKEQYGIDPAAANDALQPFTVQNLGLVDFYRQFLKDTPAPVVLAPDTRHYSWLKAATLLGLGKNSLLGVDVDFDARMSVRNLGERLEICLKTQVPVIAVVAVIGSTEENAVDPLSEILELREKFRRRGMDFAVHADAAWGGYFASLLRASGKLNQQENVEGTPASVPISDLSPHLLDQYRALAEADSITVDPHKAGYVPYPAGALCYRNSATRDLISLSAPVVFHNQLEPTVGIYGVEGSKPGAAAAAIFLAHQVIRPTREGYGKILRRCIWTSRRLYCRLVTMQDPRIRITFLQRMPAERDGKGDEEIERQKEYIRQNFVPRNNASLEAFLTSNKKAARLFARLGSDGVILTYSFNFVDPESGELNKNLDRANLLNQKIFEKCSLTTPPSCAADLNQLQLILTSSSFDPLSYGQPFVDHYCGRLGVEPRSRTPVSFLISTSMNPWTTDTPQMDFLEVIETTLRAVAHEVLAEIGYVKKAQPAG